MTNFNLLHDTLEGKEDKYTANFYNECTTRGAGNTVLSDYPNVYTEEGYELAFKMRTAKVWLEWFEKVRELNATKYTLESSAYIEDGATIIEASVQAFDENQKLIQTRKLDSTYIGYNDSDHNKRQQAFEQEMPKKFVDMVNSITDYKQYQEWKKENL